MGPVAATLASLSAGPVQFERPEYLLLIPLAGALIVWLARSSLSGLGTATRRAALAVRLVVVALIACALAEPSTRRVARDVSVVAVVDVSKSVPPSLQELVDGWVAAAAERKRPEDRLGVITIAGSAFVQSLPSPNNTRVDKSMIGRTDATDIAEGVRLALALARPDAAHRIVLSSDGNETQGSLLRAAETAKAAGVPIDVLPLRYRNTREVIVEELVSPATARMGENINLKLRVTATGRASGRIAVQMNGEQLDLDPGSPALGAAVELEPGTQWLTVPVTVPRAGPQEFAATFERDSPEDDGILENNRAIAVTFVGGEGRVLIYAEDAGDVMALERALTRARIASEVVTPEEGPQSLVELSGYDAIMLVNVPAYSFSGGMMESLRQYVHDVGGGLIMVGGPNSLGAGGWIGSPLEDALPVKLDPPQKRQMPRGALVLVMHSIEMSNGVYWGKKTAESAVEALTRLDYAGIVEYQGWGSDGATWVHPLAELGDKSAIRRAINNLRFGDMPSFDPSLRMALKGLQEVDAGMKHCIIISDGDPSLSQGILQQFRKANVTISTVAFFAHSAVDANRMKFIAEETGGKFYNIVSQADYARLPQIFFKEAQTIRRPLIWEGQPFQPAVTGAVAETMRGVPAVPPITGYVVAAEREGLALVTLRGQENDPVAAQWQYGLGRAAVFASDATTRWAGAWTMWEKFDAFWEQHVRWVMRPSGSANAKVVTEKHGDRTRVIVELRDAAVNPVNFAEFAARVAMPDGKGREVGLRQVGPGRYEGWFDSEQSGSYLLSTRYRAPGPGGGPPLEGTVQASVSRPFADEFRALSDNAALLRQVAEMTGGMELPADPKAADLWRREGLTMPVALRPIWLHVAIAAISLFLVDVGVRRVRIDLRAIGAAVAGVFSKSTARASGQIDALRTAREQARERLARRAEAPVDRATAARKFEASAEEVAAPPPVGVAVAEPPPRPAAPKAASKEEEAGMSRLLKAKKRAQSEFEDQ